jgi:hypothetical protein
LLYPLLVLLLPLGIHFLVLAILNNRERPVMVSGTYDCLGMLFAFSGFAFFVLPHVMLHLVSFSSRPVEVGPRDPRWWAVIAPYCGLVLTLGWLVLTWRRHKTVVYNVDVDRFDEIFRAVLAQLNLGANAKKNHLAIQASSTPETGFAEVATLPLPAAMTGDDVLAEVTVEVFRPMSHVTLHWDNYLSHVRRDIEVELDRKLEGAKPVVNPVGYWLNVIGFAIIAFCAMAVVLAVIAQHAGT